MRETPTTIKRTLVIGNTSGLIENARYIEGELKKTIDVGISELIKPRTKRQTNTLLRNAFVELQGRYDVLVLQMSELIGERTTLTRTNSDTSNAALGIINDINQQRLDELQQELIDKNNERVDYISEMSELKDELTQSKLNTVNARVDTSLIETNEPVEAVVANQSNNFFYKFSSNENANELIWTTSQNPRLATSNQFGTLYVQNLRTDDVNIAGLELVITEDPNDDGTKTPLRNILDHGPIGFTDARTPDGITKVNIEPGENTSIPLFGGSDIGGNSEKSIKTKGFETYVGDKTFRGTIQVMITYDNGDVAKSGVVMWTIQKSKDTPKLELVGDAIEIKPDIIVWPEKEIKLKSTKKVEKTIPIVKSIEIKKKLNTHSIKPLIESREKSIAIIKSEVIKTTKKTATRGFNINATAPTESKTTATPKTTVVPEMKSRTTVVRKTRTSLDK